MKHEYLEFVERKYNEKRMYYFVKDIDIETLLPPYVEEVKDWVESTHNHTGYEDSDAHMIMLANGVFPSNMFNESNCGSDDPKEFREIILYSQGDLHEHCDVRRMMLILHNRNHNAQNLDFEEYMRELLNDYDRNYTEIHNEMIQQMKTDYDKFQTVLLYITTHQSFCISSDSEMSFEEESDYQLWNLLNNFNEHINNHKYNPDKILYNKLRYDIYNNLYLSIDKNIKESKTPIILDT